MTHRTDIAVIGAGMAGASLAAEIAPHAKVLLIEGEGRPGYHSTGRSAAFWSETYGGALVQPLTAASGPMLADPPAEFHDLPFLSPRGSVLIARAEDKGALDTSYRSLSDAGIVLDWLERPALEALIPGLRMDWKAGILEPGCRDIDVAALHGAYLKAARRGGADLWTDARVGALERRPGGWRLETEKGPVTARLIVNAAGAWADEIAAMARVPVVGLQPYRRTIVQLRVDPPVPPGLPLVLDAGERFYFKPQTGGRLWLSPHDETACAPCDVWPEDREVAEAIDRLEQVVDWRVERVEHSWAGLRSFAPDRLPVYGFARGTSDFFWFAGQGGFGIQTAPAAAKLAAAMLLGRDPDPSVAAIDPSPYSADRWAN